VQGEGAALDIARGLAAISRVGGVDVVIVGRGGGSLEDLWAFNEEVVARAIFASAIPIVSAVGHEIDFTIADFVADRRAPTPTAAAEMVVPRKDDLLEQVNLLDQQLLRQIRKKLETSKEVYRGLVKRLADPGRKLRENQQHLDELSVDLLRRFQARLRHCKDCLGEVAGRLNALSPLAVLERGYSITHKLADGRIVKDAASLEMGDLVRITFALGKSLCRVERKE
jgi:exodeoxyribonuclease VII large subunit